MKDTVYLVLRYNGVNRMLKSMPQVRSGEVVVKLTVEVDDKNFRSPLADAHLEIGDEFVMHPEVEMQLEVEEVEEEEPQHFNPDDYEDD